MTDVSWLVAAAVVEEPCVTYQVQFVLALVFGVAGWHHARNLENKYGRPAWGLPSWVWGIITGFSLLLGVILLAVAESALKKQPAAAPAYASPPAYASAPAYASTPAYAPVAAPAPVVAAPAVPAGWQPDPSGKYQYRWWDGAAWTHSVSTNGITGTDA